MFANDAFLRMIGYSAAEVLSRNCRSMRAPETDVEAIRRASASDRSSLLNYRRDSTAFRNALFMSAVLGADGELLYFFGRQLDVTRRRAAEAAWHRSQKMEAVGQLTSGMAHDFNNLLMMIAGSLELIDKSDQPERRQRLSTRMREAVSRTLRLTGQLLAFARQQQLDGRTVDVNALVATLNGGMQRTSGPAYASKRAWTLL